MFDFFSARTLYPHLQCWCGNCARPDPRLRRLGCEDWYTSRLTRVEIRERERRVKCLAENLLINHLADHRVGSLLRSLSDYSFRMALVTYGTRQLYGLGYLRSILVPEGVGVREIIEWSY